LLPGYDRGIVVARALAINKTRENITLGIIKPQDMMLNVSMIATTLFEGTNLSMSKKFFSDVKKLGDVKSCTFYHLPPTPKAIARETVHRSKCSGKAPGELQHPC
jgi:hypothetical protein